MLPKRLWFVATIYDASYASSLSAQRALCDLLSAELGIERNYNAVVLF